MIQKRKGLFETNSSSVHAITICDTGILKTPIPPIKNVKIYFGALYEIYNTPTYKVLYLWATINYYIRSLGCTTENLERWMFINNIKIDLNTVIVQIDSIDQLYDFVQGLEHNFQLIDQFIYCPKSKIYTAYDNDYDSITVKIISRWTNIPCSTMGWQYHKSRKIGGSYFVYGKGN